MLAAVVVPLSVVVLEPAAGATAEKGLACPSLDRADVSSLGAGSANQDPATWVEAANYCRPGVCKGVQRGEYSSGVQHRATVVSHTSLV